MTLGSVLARQGFMRTTNVWLAGLAMAGLACGTPRPAAPFRELDSPSLTSAGLKASLSEHASRGAMIRDAVERGDLKGTNEQARAFVELVTKNERPMPATRLGEVVAAARDLAVVQDRPAASREFAVLAQRCGACHAAFGGPPSMHADPPPETAGLTPIMRRHQWGAARLWEGLVAPSDEAWKSGAAALSDAPFALDTDLGPRSTPKIDALAASVHDLGKRAGEATTAAARVAVYGSLLETCASCHSQLGGGPTTQ